MAMRVDVMTTWEMYREHLKDYDLKTVSEITGAAEAQIRQLADDFATIKPAAIHFGEGKTWAGRTGMTSWVLFLLAAEGRVVRGPPRGAWTSSQWRWAPAEAWLDELLPRLSRLERVGRPELVPHLHVGGVRSLNVRWIA